MNLLDTYSLPEKNCAEHGSSEVRKVPNLTQRWPHSDKTFSRKQLKKREKAARHSETDSPSHGPASEIPSSPPGRAESGRFPTSSGTPGVGPSGTVGV